MDTHSGWGVDLVNQFCLGSPGWVDASTTNCIRTYGREIKKYAALYGFDWRFVLAIMRQESHYSRFAKSPQGAAGLMQLMPETGAEMARLLANEGFSDPEDNIEAGVLYLRILYDLFEGVEETNRLELALASYNAGFSRIHDAQKVALLLNEVPTQWQGVRKALPHLSKEAYALRSSVWGQCKPASGWFENAGETIHYVDNVMGSYDTFRRTLQ